MPWIGTTAGLIRYRGGEQTLYTKASGLQNDYVWTMRGDRAGNLWLGTNGGPIKLAGVHTTNWTRADGLPDDEVKEIVEGQEGRVYVKTAAGGYVEIVAGKAVLLQRSTHGSARLDHKKVAELVQDRRGDWWAATIDGVYRLPGPTLQFDTGQRLSVANGIRATMESFWPAVVEIHEDAAGRLWIVGRRGRFRCDAPGSRSPLFASLPIEGFGSWGEWADVVSDRSARRQALLRLRRAVAAGSPA